MTRYADKPFLGEPNYYRLLYKIAALHVNEGIARSRNSASSSELMARGAKVAEDLLDAIEDARREYEGRKHLGFVRRVVQDKGPNRRDERIQTLLNRTVLPCTKILLAATMLHSDRSQEADDLVREVESADGEFSYRVYYNLACYLADRSRVKPPPPSTERMKMLREALNYLREGFLRTRTERQGQLAAWARKDPSLEPLREADELRREFRSLVSRYPKVSNSRTRGAK